MFIQHNMIQKGWVNFFFRSAFIFALLIAILGFTPTNTVEANGVKLLPVDETASEISDLIAPLYAPVAGVSLNVPATLQIGQSFSFTATFDNTGADPGYGPFIDIVFPVTGTDGAGAAVDDGIDFVSASFLGASVIAVQNTFGAANTSGCTGGLGPVTHPYAITLGSGVPHIICGTPGNKLITLLLPFGSFTPDQPAAVVTVNAIVSNLADLATSLNLRVRAGYQYGATPTNDWCCGDATIVSHSGTTTTWPASPVSPVLLSLTKSYTGPESETATGPNYPRQYTLTVDVATGQPVTNLSVTDTLPTNIQYISVESSSPVATCTTTPDPLTSPGGILTCNFGTVTGGAGTSDAIVVFNFYVPLNDSGGNPVINAVSGNDSISSNTSTAVGSWDPIDSRDPITPATAGGVCPVGCYDLTAKSIAIQKSVANVIDIGAAGNTPGDTLEYTLTFQISDFFSFQNVVLTDVFSDGQRFSGTPTLAVNGNGYILGAAGMNAANYTIDNSQIGNSGPNPPADGTNGTQTIIFRLSDEIITQGQNGILVGGCVPPNGLTFANPDTLLNCDPLNGGYDDNATTITVTFRATIQGDFTDTYPSGDSSVDHGDILTNNVTVLGDLLNAADNSTVTGQNEADTSSTSISIAFGALQKSVYAVNGIFCEPCTTEISTTGVSAGDTLTFRLGYSQPSSDFEQTVITDYLPLPIFSAVTVGSFSNMVCGIPGNGTACLGPADTYHSLVDPNPVVTPTMSTDATNNTVSFTYPPYDSVNNTSSNIDLLFTVTVDDTPFADGLFLTNQANSTEGTTNAGNQTLDTILQIRIDEPLLIPTKSVVSTDSTATGVAFVPAIGVPLVFDIPGIVDGAPDWSTNGTPGWTAGEVVNSTYLATNPINADLSGIDGGDLIKFAIVIENRGHGIDGAFDIAIKDAKPAELVLPGSGLNLEVFLGDGTPIAFTDLGGSLFGSGIMLTDPGVPASGACQAHNATSGQNVIIITYDLQLSGTGVMNPNIINTTTLLSYSSSEGGPNFIPSGVTDIARITPATPALAKTLKITSEAHTSDVSNPPRVAIGEIARYRLSVTLPEGSFTNFQIDDNLPTGLVYFDDGTARIAFISNGAGISSSDAGTLPVPAVPGACVVSGSETTAIPNPLPCALSDFNVGMDTSTTTDTDTQASFTTGLDPQFKLGTLTNADTDADRELIIVEFNALVDNSAGGGNNAGGNKDNTFQLNVNGAAYGAVSALQRVRISEPAITNITKVVNPTSADAGNTVIYTVTFSNANTANNTTAFDVNLTDVAPAKMTLDLLSLTTTYLPGACSSLTSNTSAGNNINLIFANVPVACQVTVTYQATLLNTVIPGEALVNTANIVYTSLPGTNGTSGNPTSTNTPGIPGANDGERNGSGVPVQNDYLGSDGAQVNVTQTLPVKSIVSTSQAHTSEAGDGSVGNERDLAIGEIIRYRLTVTIPEGTIPDLQLRDTLPAGFTFLNDADIRISLLANNPMATEADLTGADNDALPPTFSLPVDRIAVAGQDVTFTVASLGTAGDLINNDSDVDAEYAVIDFNVRVNNDANNNNTDIDNNDFDIVVGGVTVATSPPVGTRIVEPVLNVAKSADDSAWIYGQPVTFTLTLTHEAASLADAFDIVVTDVIPTGLTYLGGISAPAGWTTDASATPTLTWTCSTANGCSLPLAGSAALTYQVTVDSPPDPNALLGDATATNTASMVWTSLPSDNNPGNPAGERNDVDGIGGINDYTDSGSHIGGLENYYSLGNRVWFDTNNNSQIDLGTEVGMNGVLVNLYSASDLTAIIGTDTTSGGGYYLFDFLPAGDYVVAVAASNFVDIAVLDTYWSSATTMDGTGVISETAAPDADIIQADSDDNGTLQSGGTLDGAVVALPVTLGPGATEPTGETDLDGGSQGAQPDGRANMTVDFGFYRTGIGNLVWLDDVTVNGSYDNGEILVINAPVSLHAADGTTAIPVGPDGTLGTSDDAAVGITTNASGVYSFSGLPQGDYIVRAVGPAGTISTTDAFASTDTSNPNTNADNNDNGIGITSNSVSAGTLTMTPGVAGALANNIVNNATGTTGNPTVDFGFVYPYALGNRIWFDTNNNSQIDFANEVGVDSVTVDLYAADVTGNPISPIIATDITTNGGYYLFDNLIPGDYVVVLPSLNFSGAGVLTGYWSSATSRAADGTISETTAALAETNTDSDDNGTRQTSGGFTDAVISSAVTLGPIGLVEPANESDLETGIGQGVQPDGRANMTVDFGFYRVEVGNLVFGDLNKNGTYDAGDTLFNNIAVQLYAGNGTTEILVGPDGKLGTADDAAGGMTTDAVGNYLFTGLPDGNYIIKTSAPTGTASTIDSYDQADNDNPTAENTDNNDNGDGTSNGVVSSAMITLGAGSAGAKSNNTITDANGTTTNPTMDFGFSLAYALGNRVWFDTNNNSQIDYATEVGVDGVVVDLYLASDLTTSIATDTTSGGGYYLFNNLDAGDYVVVTPASNFASTAILEGYWSSGTTRNNDSSLEETSAPDADLSASDVDDNGMLQNSGTFNGAVVAQAVTIGPGGVEPTVETDLEGGTGQGQPDAQANMTVDFGFYTIQLGNLVWEDANVQDNGLYDAGAENGIQFVDIQLWSQDLGTLIATTTTNASGIYSFSSLPQGNYVARIPASEFNPGGTLRDYASSTGGVGTPYEPAPSAETNTTDSDDNGSTVGSTLGLGGYIQSSVIALTPAAEESVNDILGLTTETRVDFGVFFQTQTDLAVTKDDGTQFYIPAGTLTYLITVTNNGPSDVPNATLSDVLPPQISSWTWDCTSASGGASGCTGVTDMTSDFSDMINLPQGGGITYTVTAAVSGTASGDLTNSVTVASPGIIEMDLTNNTADDVDQPASLQISKDDGLLIVGAGSTVTYQIVVTNNGSIDLTSINVTDTLPADLTYQSASPAPTTIAGQVLTWSGLSLTSGSSATINLIAKVVASPSGSSITNDATVLDTNTGTNSSDSDTDSIATNSNFSKTLAGTDAAHTTSPNVAIGEILTYEVTMVIPPGAMDNMLVVDTPQAGLAFVDLLSVNASNPDTDAAGAGDTGLYSTAMTFNATGLCTNCADGTAVGTSNPLVENSGGKATFDFGTLINSGVIDETITIRYTVVILDIVANQDGGSLANNATWSWNGGNLLDSAPTVEIVEPDLSIDKNVNTNAAPYGAPITFTIDIAHTANSSAHAYDVVVTDELPDGLAYISGTLIFSGLTPITNNYDAGTATFTFTWDEFPLSATATITFQATFIGPSPVINATNVVWTSLPLDPTPSGPVVLSPYNVHSTERWYDPTDGGSLNNYGTQDSVTIKLPLLPNTGFAPGEITILPVQPDMLKYLDLGDFWLEIPELGVKIPIVGVPLQSVGWNLAWLGNQAGWLEGTAYPTHAGNSAITGHVYDANGNPGPFVNLNKLYWGHKIIVHMGGQKYTYEVREVRLLWPNDNKALKHEDLAWLTLITCKDYNEKTNTYAQRVAVRAVLVSVVNE